LHRDWWKRLIQWLKQGLGQILIPSHWKINRFVSQWLSELHLENTLTSIKCETKPGVFRESNSGPLAPEARIIPLDQTPNFIIWITIRITCLCYSLSSMGWFSGFAVISAYHLCSTVEESSFLHVILFLLY
jgi:hypothetical protein